MNSLRASLSSLFSSAPTPVEAVKNAIQETFNEKYIQTIEKTTAEIIRKKDGTPQYIRNGDGKWVQLKAEAKYTPKIIKGGLSDPRKGVSELSVLAEAISEVKGQSVPDMIDDRDRFSYQVALTCRAAGERFYPIQQEAVENPQLRMAAQAAETRLQAEKSVLVKLPTFVQAHIGIIEELQAFKNDRSKEYNKAIRSLNEETGFAIEALADLNRSIPDFAGVPDPKTIPVPQELIAAATKEEPEEKGVEKPDASSTSPVPTKSDKEESEEPSILQGAPEPDYLRMTRLLEKERIDIKEEELVEFSRGTKKIEGEESEEESIHGEKEAEKPPTATLTKITRQNTAPDLNNTTPHIDNQSL